MGYLVTQILLFVLLAVLAGAALGWAAAHVPAAQRLADARRRLADAHRESRRLRGEAAEHRTVREELSGERDALATAARRSEREVAELHERVDVLASAMAERDRLRAELADRDTRLMKLQGRLERQAAACRTEIATLRGRVRALEAPPGERETPDSADGEREDRDQPVPAVAARRLPVSQPTHGPELPLSAAAAGE